ncbi:MAG: hypothetical protein AB7E05_10360 [Sphingobium sp.]
MPIPPRPVRSCLLLGLLPVVLAGCGGGGKDRRDPASLDVALTNAVADPALREAVQAPLASDPDLAAEANRDAVRPSDRPLSGTLPARLTPAQGREEALRLAGGKLIPTPAATQSVYSTRDMPITLGGLIRQQQERSGGPDAPCEAEQVDYAMEWAGRMPAALPLYPGAHVTEAAGGGESGPCAYRAATFNTGAPLNEVMDFYTTMAKRSGYSVDHAEQNGGHVLSGGKGKSNLAYHIRLRDRQGGGAEVELIANGGR